MIILASKSPRRIQLLEEVGLEFVSIPSKGEETYPKGMAPMEVAAFLAKNKATEIFSVYPDATVIGADTIVVLEKEILGKPKTSKEAFLMLSSLSGTTHSVFTGVCICKNKKVTSFVEETRVVFYSLTKNQIDDYITSGDPFDKAGAYGIQGKAKLFVKEIHGDYFNVVGLPVARVMRELDSL